MVFHLAPSNLTWQWYILIETIIYIYIHYGEVQGEDPQVSVGF